MATPTEAVPLYLNWEFWTAVVAFTALILSQLPPLHILFRRARLDIEPYEKITLTHKVGNPNAYLQLIIFNTGGRAVRVKNITMIFRRDGHPPVTLLGANFSPRGGKDSTPLLLTPFTLAPTDQWANVVGFVRALSRHEEQQLRDAEARIKTDILAKRNDPALHDTLVEAEPHNVEPARKLFREWFFWDAGEYDVALTITADPPGASLEKRYRITLFESDSAELHRYADGLKIGLGVYWYNIEQQGGIHVPLTAR